VKGAQLIFKGCHVQPPSQPRQTIKEVKRILVSIIAVNQLKMGEGSTREAVPVSITGQEMENVQHNRVVMNPADAICKT
jgi:hypothetical protein